MSNTLLPSDFLPAGLILAGGKSSRMGSDKALLTIGGDTILGHVSKRLAPQVSALTVNAPADFPDPLRLRHLPDCIGGQIGPLAGVLSGLRDMEERCLGTVRLVTVPCDSPFVPHDLVVRLSGQSITDDTIVIAASGGRSHPVFGLWPASIADDLETWLSDPQNRRISAFLERHPVVTVEFEVIETRQGRLDPFFNINTPKDLDEARLFGEELT
jgi:molybdopterin-guanine dinucleotide biosynthesis protein A